MELRRTIEAEHFFEEFTGVPLTAECVFYSPKYLDKSGQEEVCDFLIVLRGEGILVSMKSQEDPTTRIGHKLERWIIKNARKALGQAQGALRTISREPIWCQHSRRGRVDFLPGSIFVKQVIVLTEINGQVVRLPDEFPTAINDIPVTYLSVNDFLNLVNELRAFPDIVNYLQARRILTDESLRIVGDERPFYQYYILNEKSFAGCCGYEDARIVSAARESDLRAFLTFKPLTDKFTSLIEYVSDALATRLGSYFEGLEPSIIARFDDPDKRKNYLLMQEELCDLRLSERQALGMQFSNLIDKVRDSDRAENMAYGACYTDSKPDFVYVLISAKGVNRAVLLKRSTILLRAALTAYNKKRGMAIADRDGEGFEIEMISEFSASPIDKKLGEEYFARLRISDIEVS